MEFHTQNMNGVEPSHHPELLLYDVTGHGDPIVLVPGILTGWASWAAHAERLAANHLVVRVQVRNVELAEAGVPIPGTYGIQTEVDGLEATLEHVGLDRVDIAGWSLGGGVALAFAIQHPQRVKSLILVEPAAPWVLKELGYADASFRAQELAERAMSGKHVTIDDLKSFLIVAGLGGPDSDFESHPRWPLMVRNRQALSVVGSVWEYTDSLDRLRGLDVPVLVVRGTEGTATDRAICDAIAATAPNASLLELPGDHSCHIQEIDRFLAAVEHHLDQ